MPCEVREDIIDQIWRDLGQQIARPRVAEVAQEVAAGLDDAKVPGYVPLFVRRLTCERLHSELRQPRTAIAAPLPKADHAP